MQKTYGKTNVILCENNEELGKRAANTIVTTFRELLTKKETIRVVFAAGESQISFFTALSKETNVDWKRIDCFNIDDFWDTRMPEKYTCGSQTTEQLYRKIQPKSVNLVKFNAPDAEKEARRFETLLRSAPIDVLCQGIGTSGHLALNEPGTTRFDDPKWVTVVDVCEQSKKQLRADPHFMALGYIPEKGITVTIPGILSATHCYTIVPLGLKKPILTRLAAISRPTTDLPASIILEKEGILFVDKDSCPDAWQS